ncbi:MAG: hypothetical protein C0407_04060, partial [Desulfobacca sp.]|nr:hypothetical protein [Desulfobacca sp.]
MTLLRHLFIKTSSFFNPPVFPDDEEKTRIATVLNYLLSSMIILVLFGGLIGVPFFIIKKVFGSITIAACALVILVSRTLMHKGQVRESGLFLVVGIWIITMTLIVCGEGLKDMNVVFLLSNTLFTGLLLGKRFVIGMVLVNIISLWILVFMEKIGYLPLKYLPFPPIIRWGEFSAALIITATAIHLGLRSREEALSLAGKELSERKQAQEALNESEKRYRLMAEHTADVIWSMDLNYNFTYVSPSVTKMRGLTVQEAMAQKIPDFLTPASLQQALQAMGEENERRRLNPMDWDRKITIELEEYRKDGSTVWTENEITYIGGDNQEPIGIVGVTRDISEQRRNKEALRVSEERFRSLIQSSSDIIIIINEQGRVIYESPSTERILGYPSGTFIGQSPFSLIHPDDLDRVGKDLDQVFQSIYDGNTTEFRCRKVDGSWVHLEAVGSNQFTNPSVRGIVLNVREITQRKLAEKALEESEGLYRALIETTNTGYVVLDHEGRVLDANEEYVHLTGYHSLNEIQGRSVLEWTAEYEKAKNFEAVKKCFKEGFIRNLEIDYRDSQGKIVPIEINATVVEKEGWPHILSLCRDISERKRVERVRQELEERLRRAEKMESLGRLAGGVAHDLNNVLGVLVGYSELLLMDIPEGNPLREHVSNILNAGERGAAIIQDLLALARRGVSAAEVLNLNQIISGYVKTPEFEMLKVYHPNIKITFDPTPDLLNIKGSPVHLNKTIMNLVVNAAEAISSAGEVIVRTQNCYLDRPIRGYDDMQEGDYAVLTVSDNGQGIATKDVEKIFEPFYTKKVMGRSGTGLGLAVVWGTVKDHGGYIDVQSWEEKGSVFTLYFPITREELPVKGPVIPMENYMGRGESILVVDDMKEQRELVTNMLTRLGYTVTAASSGEEALSCLQ